jgi:hypothetical protein
MSIKHDIDQSNEYRMFSYGKKPNLNEEDFLILSVRITFEKGYTEKIVSVILA